MDMTVKEKALEKRIKIIKKEQDKMFTHFRETSPKFRVDNLLNDLAMSVAEGRVDELLVNNNFSQMGSITDQGSYVGSDDDFIKAPITKVISSKGKVYIVEEVDMPEHINISQRLRY